MRHQSSLPLLVLAFVPLLGSHAAAQWSSDASENLLAVDRAGEQTQPKLAPTADGGFYLGWFDNDPDGSPAFGYDVYLQRFDSAGNEQWAHDGVLVADLGLSSTTDWDLDTDAAGNALLTFQDDRGTGVQITAAKVDASGSALWGASGIQLTNTAAFVANPKIAGTTDGDAVVAWVQDNTAHLQRLDAAGAAQWTEIVLTPGAGSYAPNDLDTTESGTCILSFTHQTGGFGSPRHILAQKYDSAGTAAWGAHVPVFDGGSLQFGNFPQFEPDGAGGAVFAWYAVSPLECYAQRLDADGAELFPHDGVALSTDATRLRVSPAVAFDADTQSTYVVAVQTNSLQSQFGVVAQKLDATGARQWGVNGVTLVALGTAATAETECLVVGSRIAATWTSAPSFGQDVARVALLDPAGALALPIFPLSSTAAVKYRFQAANSSFGHGIWAWRDERDADAHVYLQDLLPSGLLGGLASTASRNGSNVNVVCYTAVSDARLGTSWTTSISHAHHPGATSTVIQGRTTAISGPVLTYGQVLIAGPRIFQHAQAATGSADVHALPVPVDLTLVGVTLRTQALILGGGLELGNALDITLGL